MKLVNRVVVAFFGGVLLLGCSADDEGRALPDGGITNGNVDAQSTMDAPVQPDATKLDANTSADAAAAPDAIDTTADATPDAPPCGVEPQATRTAKLRVTCDDFVRIYFNGVLVAEPTSLWTTLKEYDVNVFLYPQKQNVIAIECRNAYEQNNYDRGMVAELAYFVGEQTKYVKTDATWRASATASENWTAADFNDTTWAQAQSLGASGISPWSDVLPNSKAEWLWTYLPTGAPSEKPDDEKNYFRKIFFMDTQGQATNAPVNCK